MRSQKKISTLADDPWRNYRHLRDEVVTNLSVEQYYTLDEWAERKRVLSAKHSEAGKFNFTRTPYLREIMRELSPQSLTQKVVVMKAPQLGMTELAVSWLLYIIDVVPSTAYYVTTTNDEATKFVRSRFNPEILVHQFLLPRFRIGGDIRRMANVSIKTFAGGEIFFTSGNTSTPFRSRSVKNVIVDEADLLPANIGGEGDPIQLLENRQKTYYDKKMLIISTPSLEGEMDSTQTEVKRSIIQREYLLGDRRKYFVPCPLCAEFQPLEFENLVHDITGSGVKLYGYLCAHCNAVFDEKHKTEMLRAGQWRATHANPEEPLTKSYHINGLYSPALWQSWLYHVKLYYSSLRDRMKKINFTNNTLALPFSEAVLSISAEQLLARRETYNAQSVQDASQNALPAGILFLTAGVDVHKRRLECSIWGWGLGMESWLITHKVFTAVNSSNISDTCWLSLDAYLRTMWCLHNGTVVSLEHALIDMGYNSATVLTFCKGVDYAYLPVKGNNSGVVAVKQNTSRYAGRIDVNTELVKTNFFAKLHDVHAGDRGYVHFPKSMESVEFYRQLVSERKVYENGKATWKKTRLRNEALDCRVYAEAGAMIFGLPEWREEEAETYLKNIR